LRRRETADAELRLELRHGKWRLHWNPGLPNRRGSRYLGRRP